MLSRVRRAVGLTVGVALLSAGLVAAPSAQAAPHALIVGSGSSWAANAVLEWVSDVHRTGLQVVYAPNGSASGRQDFANHTVDFAVSDLPYQGVDPATGASDTAQGRAFTTVPVFAGGLSFPYHLEVDGKLLTDLRLSGRSIAGIFTGAITYWDDPQIEADNRGRIALPHLAITPVVHAEGSATSYRLGDYLSSQYPQIWGDRGAPSAYFPRPADAQAEQGSDGVVDAVSSGAGNGSIGYDEYSYSLGKDYPVAAVQNRAGDFVLPHGNNVAVALRSATADGFDTGDLSAVYESIDAQAYPLSSWSSAIVPTGADDASATTAKRQTTIDFLAYALCGGQRELAGVGFAPLPLNLVQAGFAGLSTMARADPHVDGSALDVTTCSGDPTFKAGNPPTDDLDTEAPQPPACAGPTAGPCGVPADTTTLATPAGTTVSAGRVTLLSTRLFDATTGRLLGGVPVTLWQRPARASTWQRLSTGTTTRSGVRSVGVRPKVSTYYQFRYVGDADQAPVRANAALVRVQPVVSLHATPTRPRPGAGVLVWGAVAPGRTGRVDTIQVLMPGGWRVVGHAAEGYRRNPDGRAGVSYAAICRFSPAGTYRVRVATPASVDVLAGLSQVLTVVVR